MTRAIVMPKGMSSHIANTCDAFVPRGICTGSKCLTMNAAHDASSLAWVGSVVPQVVFQSSVCSQIRIWIHLDAQTIADIHRPHATDDNMFPLCRNVVYCKLETRECDEPIDIPNAPTRAKLTRLDEPDVAPSGRQSWVHSFTWCAATSAPHTARVDEPYMKVRSLGISRRD